MVSHTATLYLNWFKEWNTFLPNLNLRLFVARHRVARLPVERFGKAGKVGRRANGPILPRRMRIRIEVDFKRFGSDILAPHQSTVHKEGLRLRIAVDLVLCKRGLLVQFTLQCVMRDSESAQIANIFTQGQFAIHMQTGQRLILTELFDELGSARIEFLTVSVGPPVHAIALGIELTALVIITMYHFMTDDRADAAVIQRIVRLRVEERRLQDGG